MLKCSRKNENMLRNENEKLPKNRFGTIWCFSLFIYFQGATTAKKKNHMMNSC